MKYLDLNNLTPDHLSGDWKVLDRFVNRSDASSPFVQIDTLSFLPAMHFMATNGADMTGTWTFSREQEVIYNPQLVFSVGGEDVASAIITRLSTTQPEPDPVFHLTLYFTNGLELVLEKPVD
ncbi:MAG TPA: hypothetical protein VK927_05315 [Adhaeribacter sp.]|nr:hypothetical protein [Adhaeribacter sp.]